MITTIVVNYKSHQLAIRAAQSVYADRPDGQIIVVDNSECPQEVMALEAGLPKGVELHVSPQNIGFGRACNAALEKAKHDWIFLLNPDASVLPGCLDKLQSFLESTPGAGAVSPLSYWDHACTWRLPPGQMPSPGVDFAVNLAMRFPSLGVKTSIGFRSWALTRLRSPTAKKLNMLSGGHVFLRKSAIAASGGLFDDNIFMYFEDTDLCRRLKSAGYGLHFLPSAQVIHSWQCQPSKAHLSETSHRYYLKKHFPKNRWPVAQGFLARHFPIRLPSSIDLGVLTDPPHIQVPAEWQSAWVLEGSPHPLMIPAAYLVGKGAVATFSAEVWALLGEGSYWIQLSPAKDQILPKEINRYAFRIPPMSSVVL
ncbi:MAG: glycosyltransferase family 2 protein [Pseudomonadota bacterium]